MTRFVKDRTFETEMKGAPELKSFIEVTATDVAAVVRETAPAHTGYYKRRIVPFGTRVYSRDPFWHLVEYGSTNNAAYAPLRRGVLAAGLRLDEKLK